MVWFLVMGLIAAVCLLVFRPDVVAAFWATVAIVGFAFLAREMFDDWFVRKVMKRDRRRGRGRRKDDRPPGRTSARSYDQPYGLTEERRTRA